MGDESYRTDVRPVKRTAATVRRSRRHSRSRGAVSRSRRVALSRVDRAPPAALGLCRLRLLLAFEAAPQLHETVAQLGGALELEIACGAEHLFLHVLGEAQDLVGRQTRRLLEGRSTERLLVAMRLHLVDGLDDRQRRDVVLDVVGDLD